jgi:hypothetical protein
MSSGSSAFTSVAPASGIGCRFTMVIARPPPGESR